MVYYLGRDVKVYITTESDETQVDITGAGTALSPYGVTTEGAGAAADVAATATVTIGGHTAVGRVITIINTAGTSITYTSAADEDFSENEFDGNTGASTVVADSLKAAIEHASGHNGTITVSRSGEVLTLTQSVSGTAGNTTITSTLAATTKTNFTGGNSTVNYVAGTTFAENLDSSPPLTAIPDLTGVDLGIGVTDEDVTYIGSKTVLKAEIKKETTITLTRKKTNNVWDVVYNGPTAANKGWTGSAAETGDYGARWGVIEGSADNWYIMNGSAEPKTITDADGTDVTFGYRVFIELNGDTDTVYAIPGCQLVGHTVTLNADGTTEETCELISHVTPKLKNALDYDRLTAADM